MTVEKYAAKFGVKAAVIRYSKTFTKINVQGFETERLSQITRMGDNEITELRPTY